jgi:hypothetical protein
MNNVEESFEGLSRRGLIKVLEEYEHAFQSSQKELEFLRYFYDAAGDAFGPADSDIYQMIKDNYAGELPEGY